MQNVESTENNDATKEIKTVEIDQNTQTSAMTGPTLIENPQVPTSQSTFELDVSCSDDDEVSEVDSFILDTEDADPVLEPSFLLPQSMEGANLQTVTVDPETHARLEALLEAAGIGKLSTADGKALTDPEVLRKLTSSVSCALDEAAQALHRMRAEQQLGTIDSSRSLAEACSDGDVPTVRKLLREGGSVHETTEEGDSLLSLACSAGYYELAQVLLAMKANVEDRGIKGDCTPLMEAASGGYVDIVKLLISHGADVNAQSSAGNTPLHYGACGGYMDVVQVLIEAGANVEQHNENGHTPLMEAASAGHVSVASILLQAGAGINTHSNEFKESALTLACYKGHLDMVKFLLEAGADQEHKTDEMHTALMEASMDGHVEVAKLLLDSGAQVNMPADSFESPLTLAACGGHVELALLLIERGANLEEVNDEGYTPLMEAAREGHEEMVALLLAHDADINAQTEETQETALTLACCGGFLDVADFLITAGADIELGCSTPLMEAAQEGHLELVKYLLKARANVQAQTGTGDTALTYACENGHTDVAEVLLNHGAVLEHESEGGRTPLMKAARAGHLCTVQFLISKGADVNRQTSTNDHTVLSLACAGGHLAVVELLLAQGADPAHKLKDGSTMVIEAAKGGHTQVVKLLLEYPNRMLMNTQQDLPQVTASEPHLVESRVPIHGLANIVPPSEPDCHLSKPNNLTTCEHADTAGVMRKATAAEMNIPIKPADQILQNMQKSLAKKPSGTGNIQQSDTTNKSNKNLNIANSGDVSSQVAENGELPDIMSDETIDLKATERLEAIISNVMAKELINTTSTREEQILRKQQILEELQKVERELQEKAQQQLLITAQQQFEQQQQQQLQQALQASVSNKPLHKVLQKQLEEQGKKKLPLSSPTVTSSKEVPSSKDTAVQLSKETAVPSLEDTAPPPKDAAVPVSKESSENQLSNNLDKQVPKQVDVTTASPTEKPNIPENVPVVSQTAEVGVADKQPSRQNKEMNNNKSVKTNGGLLSTNGGSQSAEHNGASQSTEGPKSPSVQQTTSQPKPQPQTPSQPTSQPRPASPMSKPQLPSQSLAGQPLMFNPPSLATTMTTMTTMSQPAMIPPPKPPTLLPQPTQQQQLEQQQQLLLQQQQQQQAVMPQFVLNETQRQTLHNLILRQQQEAQQLAQQASSLPFHQLQLTPQQQDQLFQVLSNQQISQQMLQQQQPQNLQQQQQQQQLQNLLQQQSTVTQQILNQQQQAQFLQQQQQAQFLQQQLQQIKPPVNPQKPAQRKTKNLLNAQQMNNQEQGMLGIDTITPRSPPSTPLTPNPSPASPDSISPLYAPIDLDAQTESNHDTALTLACAGGHSELVTLLLSKGADIEHRDKKGFTPLILAATAGHVDVVEILLEHGADIEAQSERTKDTPLSLACSGGRYEVVELLLSRGANKEHRNVSDYTPLSLAASGGFVNIIKLLLSHGAEINSRTGSKLGISPLMLAAMNGHTAAVKLLLDMGSDINAQIETNKNTALTLACFQGRHEVVSLLVDRRAIIEHRAKTGLTPLMEAASGGYVEVGRVLLDKGADVNAPPVPSSRDTALTIAADKGHYRFVELLLSRHAAVDVKNKKGNSPLWLACHGGHLDVVQLIVAAGADIDSQDNRKVSCLMAAFRKGHIKVVKWMVKHVNQFPSDGDLTRYISTVTDKELQKKCQQCMEIIVTAKDRQAAEAYKHATNLLELLDKERQQEENKKAAAAKKREKKKKKKKEKQGKDKEEPSDSKNSTPEPESEDSQPKEKDKEEQPLVLQPPTATTTSTLGLTLPISEPIYTKAKNRNNKSEKKNIKTESQVTTVKPEDKRNSKADSQIVENKSPRQDENKEPRNNKGDSVKDKTNAKITETKKNKKNRRDKENDRVPDISFSGDISTNTVTITSSTVMSNDMVGNKGKKLTASNRKKKGERFGKDLPVESSTTPIGDLDDFGNLPSISEKDIEKLRKTKISDKGGSNYIDKSHPESNPNTLSVKTSPNLVNSPKRGQKKEDGWKEVIRKSKKVPVPASAISRVIGRGGCNIKAIREVSGANIDVEKNKGSSGERIITIKGSAEATRQAHALITALVTDPDKELQEILPKGKAKQQLDKSLYFIPPGETSSSSSISQNMGNQQSKSNKLAPRLQAAQASANSSRQTMGGGGVMNSPIPVWCGPPTTTSASPQRSSKKPTANPPIFSSPGPGMNGNIMDKTVTRQLFSGEQKRKGFGNPNMITTQQGTISGSAGNKPTPSSPPNYNIRPDMRLSPGTRNQAKPLVPGNVKVLQRPNSGTGLQPQPLPIIPNQPTTTATTQTITSSTGFNISSASGEFSPFDNFFSNAAQQLLGKKEDSTSERMNFASVAAAGVLPPFSGSPGNVGTPVSPGGPTDPNLLAKAPGFKPPGPRMMTPLDMAPGFKGGGFQMSPQVMEMNMPPLYGMNGPGVQGLQNFHQPPQNQSPNSSPRSSQSGSGMSPHSNSGFDSSVSSLQREEYTTPNQPMTLPKISSSLNPNAPDFTSRTAPPGSNSGPGGPGSLPNMPGMGIIPQAMYQQALAQQLLTAFSTMGPAPNPPPGAPSPGPQNPDPVLGMSGQFNKQEFYQNMANLMHQWALQNQPPGSPGPVMGPNQGAGFTPPIPRAFSPLQAQGRPNSAPSIGGLSKEGPSPTPIGPPRTNSPLPPSTPPMSDFMRPNEDRRQPRPIGGERSVRKAPGPGPLGVPANLEFNEPLWNLSPQLNMDWHMKGTSPLTSGMSSVMTTSVLSGGHMATNLSSNGDERLDLENHDPSRGLDSFSGQNFTSGLQGQELGQMPLFNGVGPYPLQDGTGFGGSGDGLQNMWNSMETPDSEDITEKGMWNSWSK